MAGPHFNQPGSGVTFYVYRKLRTLEIDQTTCTNTVCWTALSTQWWILSPRKHWLPVAAPAGCHVCHLLRTRVDEHHEPALSQCLHGWTKQYNGLFVADDEVPSRLRSSYVCLDGAPEARVGGKPAGWYSAIFTMKGRMRDASLSGVRLCTWLDLRRVHQVKLYRRSSDYMN